MALIIAVTLLANLHVASSYSVSIFVDGSCDPGSNQVDLRTVQMALQVVSLRLPLSKNISVSIVDSCDYVTASQMLLSAVTNSTVDALVGPSNIRLCPLFISLLFATNKSLFSINCVSTKNSVQYMDMDSISNSNIINVNSSSSSSSYSNSNWNVDLKSAVWWLLPSMADTTNAMSTILAHFRWHTLAVVYSGRTFYRDIANQVYISLTSIGYKIVFITDLPYNNMTSFVQQNANQMQSIKGTSSSMLCFNRISYMFTHTHIYTRALTYACSHKRKH